MAKNVNDRATELLAQAEELRKKIRTPKLNPENKRKLQKELVLICLEMSFGIVGAACKNAGIGRTTYYDWFNNDLDFREKCQEITESQIDLAEAALFKNIQKGDTTSIIFLLKYRGKDRGYANKTIIEGDIKQTTLTAEEAIEKLNDKELNILADIGSKILKNE